MCDLVLASMIMVGTFIGVYRPSVVPGSFAADVHAEGLGGEDGGVFACDAGGEFHPFLGLRLH